MVLQKNTNSLNTYIKTWQTGILMWKKTITKCKHIQKELLLEIELKSDKIG